MIGSKIIRKDQVPSTNTLAMDLLKDQNLPDGTVIWAVDQTQGRGQRGNRWESESGKNLTFSTILYPHFLKVEDQFMVSKVASLAIIDFLSTCIHCPKIKWPNDIYVENDKIAGILIENSIISSQFDYVIIGIGLNINQVKFSSEIPNPTSLKTVTGTEYSVESVLKDLNDKLGNRYKQLIEYEIDTLNNDYLSHLYRYDEFFQYQYGQEVFSAKITGLDPFGAIVLETEKGDIRTFGFREVEYIL